MSTTALETPSGVTSVPVTTEIHVTITKAEKIDNAFDVKTVLEEALERKKAIADAIGEGATVIGSIQIGKQKHKL